MAEAEAWLRAVMNRLLGRILLWALLVTVAVSAVAVGCLAILARR